MGKHLLILAVFISLLVNLAIVMGEAAQEKPAQPKIEVLEMKPFAYCALEMTGSYDQHESAFGSLYEEAGRQNLSENEIPFGIYWNNPQEVEVAQLKWELGFAVPEESKIETPLKLKKWEFTSLATTTCEVEYQSEEMQKIYQELFTWIAQNGYIPAGPMMEKYLTMPHQNEKGEWGGKVQILMPVKKSK